MRLIIAEECNSAKITYALTCKYDLTMEQTRIDYINIMSTVDQKRKIVHSFLWKLAKSKNKNFFEWNGRPCYYNKLSFILPGFCSQLTLICLHLLVNKVDLCVFVQCSLFFKNVSKNTSQFKRLNVFTPVYRDICRTCEALDLWVWGLVTSQDSWCWKVSQFD